MDEELFWEDQRKQEKMRRKSMSTIEKNLEDFFIPLVAISVLALVILGLKFLILEIVTIIS